LDDKELQNLFNQNRQYRQDFFSPRRIARISILIAISAVGALIKIPSPTGTVALDSCTGYFAAVAFGWTEGAIIAGLGHLLTAFTTGFPLSLPVHLYIALQMTIYVSLFGIIARKINLILGIIVGVLLNGVLSSFLIIPFGGMGMATALLLPLTVGSLVNIIIAALAYKIVAKSNLL
jgi:uncharacterized membrane protein